MKFDVFCEIQRAFPWNGKDEQGLFAEVLAQARAAEAAGFDIWWEVEHHGAPEFSYSSAPEVVLTAIAMSTQRLRVGHAGVLAPFRINAPLRVAERGATLDLLSNGRFELGLAKSGGKEWETFGVNPDTARDQVRDAMRMIPRMWTEREFAFRSDDYEVPPREVTPKPLQKPHPRLWQTCGSPDSFYMAGELGVGALGTTLLSPVPSSARCCASTTAAWPIAGPPRARWSIRRRASSPSSTWPRIAPRRSATAPPGRPSGMSTPRPPCSRCRAASGTT